jgi:hypothetical protein
MIAAPVAGAASVSRAVPPPPEEVCPSGPVGVASEPGAPSDDCASTAASTFDPLSATPPLPPPLPLEVPEPPPPLEPPAPLELKLPLEPPPPLAPLEVPCDAGGTPASQAPQMTTAAATSKLKLRFITTFRFAAIPDGGPARSEQSPRASQRTCRQATPYTEPMKTTRPSRLGPLTLAQATRCPAGQRFAMPRFLHPRSVTRRAKAVQGRTRVVL